MSYTQEQLEKWNYAIECFRKRPDVNPVSFEQWIKPIKLYAVISNEVIATSPCLHMMGPFIGRYRSDLEVVIRTVFGMEYSLTLTDPDKVPQIPTTPASASSLNPKYKFENFITGESNRFAYASALAVAEAPGLAYNPYFVYGDVGLGKTHLMNAIGNFILQRNPNTNILLTTSEALTNELVESILKHQGGSELRNKMRTVDVLMVDDIQFLSKTTRTQEEFFHTFNELYNNNKQIIVTSDRPPKELPTLEERLRSRFNWGLTVDIQKPDYETRIAILQQKAEEAGIAIPRDAIEYIAAHFDKSIRDLEGALTRVSAQSRLLNVPISLSLTESALGSLVTTQDTREITPQLIMMVISKKYSVSVDDLLSANRSRDIAVPRQIAIYLTRKLTELSTTSIGAAFGNRDHTTVLHSCEKIAKQVKDDVSFKRKMEELIDLVRNS